MFSFVALTSLTLLAYDARAQGERDITMPPECGTRAAFDVELRQRLGPDAPVDSVHVSISKNIHRFKLRVEIGAEHRELEDEDCVELFRAGVVVAVAMLLHDRTPPQAAPSLAPSEPVLTKPPRAEPRFTLGFGAGVNIGTLQLPTPVLEMEGQALWRSWGTALGVRYLLPSKKLDELQRGATLQAVSAHVAGVFRPARNWQARAGFAIQRLSGEGHGSTQTQNASVWAAGPTLGLAFVPYERPEDRLWLGLGIEGQLNALRGRFQIRNYNQLDDQDVHVVPWLSGSAFVRLGLVW